MTVNRSTLYRLLPAAGLVVFIAAAFGAMQRNFGAEASQPVEVAQAERETAAGPNAGPGWGNLTGTFLFDGPAPPQPPISPNKDEAYCSKTPLVDESLIVNPGSKGIANIVIRLETKAGQKLAVHDSFARTAESRVVLDNKTCRFLPHVCLLRTTQTLVITNSDDVSHNTAAYLDRNDPFNEVTAVGQSTEKRIARPERMPSKVNCSIHPWMTGWLVVSDHPYAAVTNEKGEFQIPSLPAGEHTFQIWHEKAGWVRSATRDGKPVEWKRGRVTLRIQPGENSLGEIRLRPAVFAPDEAP